MAVSTSTSTPSVVSSRASSNSLFCGAPTSGGKYCVRIRSLTPLILMRRKMPYEYCRVFQALQACYRLRLEKHD
jgi:hypothetical protein